MALVTAHREYWGHSHVTFSLGAPAVGRDQLGLCATPLDDQFRSARGVQTSQALEGGVPAHWQPSETVFWWIVDGGKDLPVYDVVGPCDSLGRPRPTLGVLWGRPNTTLCNPLPVSLFSLLFLKPRRSLRVWRPATHPASSICRARSPRRRSLAWSTSLRFLSYGRTGATGERYALVVCAHGVGATPLAPLCESL